MQQLFMEILMSSPSSELIKHHTVHASAGAGKTTQLIQELMNSIHHYRKKYGTFPHIIVTTFTRNATHEVKERVIAEAIKNEDWNLVQAIHESNQIFISTLHGILYSFLRKYFSHQFGQVLFMSPLQTHLGVRSILRDIIEDPAFLPLIRYYNLNELCSFITLHMDNIYVCPALKPLSKKEMLHHWWAELSELKISIPSDIPPENTQEVYTFLKEQVELKKIKESDFNSFFEEHHPQYYREMENQYILFQKCVEIFQKKWDEYKKRKGWIQIEDLEYEVLQMIKNKSPELSAFSKDYSEWFIDEYQDISPSQELILKHLTQQAKKVWAVGDPQQSIYLFRKADPEVFQRRIKKGSVEKNHSNYRSTPELLAFFNDLFKNKFEPMTTKKTSKNPSLPSAYFLIYQSEIQALAQHLNQLFQLGTQPQDICILCKKNQDAQQIGYHLKQLGFPIQSHSKNSIKREILDALFLLRFLSNPLDNQNLIGLLRAPYFYMPDDQIAQYSVKNECLWKNLVNNKKNDSTVHSLNNLLQKVQQEGFSHTLSYAFENHFMIDLCYIQDPTREKEKNLWNFLLELQKKEEGFNFRITQFIEEKMNQAQDYEVDGGGTSCKPLEFIQVMTIHQSKGLEFDHVIISQVDQKLVPSDTNRFIIDTSSLRWSFSIYDEKGRNTHPLLQKKYKDKKRAEELLEQDRLLYVAATRAKKSLSFMISKSYWKKWHNGKSLNNWLKKFPYFELIHKKYNSEQKQNLQFGKYTVEIQNIELPSDPSCILHKKQEDQVLSPFSYEKTPPKKSIECSTLTPLSISTFQKIESSYKGIEIHLVMNKIQQQKDINIVLKNFSKTEREYLEPICNYVLNLKEIPMKEIMKNGFSEWGFIYEDEDYQIKGVIDLWGTAGNTIWIVDYKSSTKISKHFWNQLGLYAFALNKKYPEKEIKMCIIQPLIQKCHIQCVHQEFLEQIQNFIKEYEK